MATVTPDKQAKTRLWPDFVDLLSLHRLNPDRYPYLLASTSKSHLASPEAQAADRFDILFAFPQARLELWPDGLKVDRLQTTATTFLAALDECWQQVSQAQSDDNTALPFRGGWFIYLGYELAAEVEPGLRLAYNKDSQIPISLACRIPVAIVNDRYQHKTWLVSETGTDALLETLFEDIEQVTAKGAEIAASSLAMQEEKAQKFLDGVARVKDYIREGDVFQVNLSRRWQGDNTNTQALTPQTVFTQLARTNPAPYAGLACFGPAAIVSSSPERLVRVQQNRVETRPIAGTRPRGKDDLSDKKNLQELIGHPKERAEHVMLIDLERNDLGRVCQHGSIEVNELMVLETYAHVHHIVSNVRGRLKPGCTPGEVIRAVFPGGTITGCPKVRCMEIIAELEQEARGPYTGAMGYLNHNGDMDLNILIRTMVMDQGSISFRAGAGLVADSIAENELNETRAKAKGMLLSLQGESGA